MKLRIKKIIIFCILTLGFLFSSGCAGMDIPADLVTDLKTALVTRADENIKMAQSLCNSGIISESTFNIIQENVQKNITEMANSLDDEATLLKLMQSVTDWQVIPNNYSTNPCWLIYDKGQVVGHEMTFSTEADFANQYLTNFLAYYDNQSNSSKEGTLFKNNLIIANKDGGNGQIKPIEIINDTAIAEINKTYAYQVFVLNTNFNNQGLDEIIEAIKKATDEKNQGILDQYFHGLTYTKNGKEEKVTLLDTDKAENQLIRDSRGGRADDNNNVTDYLPSIWIGSTGWTGEQKRTNAHWGSHQQYSDDKAHPTAVGYLKDSKSPNRLGQDMVVECKGRDVMEVRFKEFNQDAIDKLMQVIGIADSAYYVLNDRVYVMLYPVGYIAGFKETEDRNSYQPIIKKSQLSLNVMTGKVYKSEFDEEGNVVPIDTIDTNGNAIQVTAVEVSSDDPYYSIAGALSNSADPQSSFILYGETGITKDGEEIDECNEPWDLKYGNVDLSNLDDKTDGVAASVGRIVLRDYLEATYAPGVVSGDSLVVLGRKFRVENLTGLKTEAVGHFYDKEGLMLEDSTNIYINDLADIDSVLGSPQIVATISGSKETLSASETEGGGDGEDGGDGGGTEDTSGDTGDSIADSISKIDLLPKKIVSSINCSTTFPGPRIGNPDWKPEDSKPLFYSMLITRSMFETGLFSGWVQSTDQAKNSTTWWNDWLSSHSFQYRINTDNLVDYLKGNYAYDLNKEGVIILDLETISKIQQEFTQDAKNNMAMGLRTIFVVFGYLLIAYSIVLLIAWNVDVNVDLGFNILEKLSLGKWIAVKDPSEFPVFNNEETNYVGFGQLIVSCIAIMVMGIILILVNIMDIVLMLIQLFGGIATYIVRLVTGV